MMKLSTFVLLSLFLAGVPTFAASKYGPQAVKLHDDHAYIIHQAASDYWALSPYYIAQQDPGACILASFTMTLNAFRANDKLTASDALITQSTLLKTLVKEPAAKRFYVDHGKTVILREMVELFQKAASELIHKDLKVEGIVVEKDDQATRDRIEKILIENEKSAHNFVIANFLQSEYTGDPEGKVGHAAPVAGYDVAHKRVLILDPDREYYEPYWVSLSTFVKGLATLDKDAGKNRGILWIHE
jgi:hypothetical protein